MLWLPQNAAAIIFRLLACESDKSDILYSIHVIGDKLLCKLSQMNFDGIVLVEFTKGSKESNFIDDIRKLRMI